MGNSAVLLVEGRDDRHVMYALMKHHGVPAVFDIQEMDGIDNLLEDVPVRIRLTDLKRLGILVDADLSVRARWDAVIGILERAGYSNLPRSPLPEGSLFPAPDDLHPMVGLWIMPNNTVPGLLEDFVKFLVPQGDRLFDRAVGCVSRIPPNQRRFPPPQASKAEVHTWLAWQETPGRPIGTAIGARYLDPDSPHAADLIAWLRRLFTRPQ